VKSTFFACSVLLVVTSCTDIPPRHDQAKLDVAATKGAILQRMNWDHFFLGDWSAGVVRELRIVPLARGLSLIAFEVFSNDFSGSGGIQWQVATVDLAGVRSEWSVLFPGQPCSPDLLRSNISLVQGVSGAEIEMLKTGVGCEHTQFVFEPQDRVYQHRQEWKLKIAAMEKDLSDFVADVGIKNGEVIVGDIEDSDEEFRGLAVDRDRGFCWSLSGVVLRSRSSSVYRIDSALYHDPIERVSPADLGRLLHAPLLWEVRTAAGKSAIIRNKSKIY
jgi:hypothetical protein